MKKSLLAVAAMTAFAGAAQAQSSVTVYGILDVGFVGSSYNGTSGTANSAPNSNGAVTGSATSKQSTAGFGQSAESTSRIGFKGTEDLGGGTQALFTVEVSLSPDSNGAAASGAYASATNSSLVSQPAVFGQVNRQTFVGLHKNGLGQASIGTQYTPMFNVQSATDAAGNNNLVGNAVYSGGLQSGTGTFNPGLSAYGASNAYFDAAYSAYVTRVSNALFVQSDRIAGFQAGAMYAQYNTNNTATAAAFNGGANGAGGSNNNTMYGLSADYVWKNLKVVAAFQNIRSYDPAAQYFDSTAASLTAASPIPASKGTVAGGTADSFGLNTSDNTTYAAATYDFGIVKAYGLYVTRRAISVIDGTYSAARTAYQLGARSQLTPTISVYATMGLGKATPYGQGNLGNNNFRTAQLGTDYNLSKRTNLYLAYGSYNQSSAGGTDTSKSYNVGLSGMNYAAGIRHTF